MEGSPRQWLRVFPQQLVVQFGPGASAFCSLTLVFMPADQLLYFAVNLRMLEEPIEYRDRFEENVVACGIDKYPAHKGINTRDDVEKSLSQMKW